MELQKILVVDDDKSVQLLMRAGASRTGNLTIQMAGNGQEALDCLKTWTPDLILMDVMMPVLGGFETLKIILLDQELKKIPVVMMSASIDQEKLKTFMEEGAIGVILKPFTPHKVIKELNDLYASNLLRD